MTGRYHYNHHTITILFITIQYNIKQLMHNQSASHSSSLTHFKHFVERIMSAPEEHDGKVCIGDRTLTNLRFAEYIGAVAE